MVVQTRDVENKKGEVVSQSRSVRSLASVRVHTFMIPVERRNIQETVVCVRVKINERNKEKRKEADVRREPGYEKGTNRTANSGKPGKRYAEIRVKNA